jgi:hypothetical protein
MQAMSPRGAHTERERVTPLQAAFNQASSQRRRHPGGGAQGERSQHPFGVVGELVRGPHGPGRMLQRRISAALDVSRQQLWPE